jgi:hypothetical protein
MIILSGDVVIGGRVLLTGDQHITPAGNDHGETHTTGGCLFFVQWAG